jgi:hypothetical protein
LDVTTGWRGAAPVLTARCGVCGRRWDLPAWPEVASALRFAVCAHDETDDLSDLLADLAAALEGRSSRAV